MSTFRSKARSRLRTYEYLWHYHSMIQHTHSYVEDHKVSIGEAARIAGVSISTLRRWERQGLIEPSRTLGGQRRYSVQGLRNLESDDLTDHAEQPTQARSA